MWSPNIAQFVVLVSSSQTFVRAEAEVESSAQNVPVHHRADAGE